MERRGFLGSVAAFFGAGAGAQIKPLPYIDEIREKERQEKAFWDQPLEEPQFSASSGVLLDLADRDIISQPTACSGIIPNWRNT